MTVISFFTSNMELVGIYYDFEELRPFYEAEVDKEGHPSFKLWLDEMALDGRLSVTRL